ncbi:MAG: UDP-N-acetylmuramoyl-L-alanyl-D-glutamate--2,6-diaminopimelate ligase [Desulfobacterales bacterium]|nr:UDP-N-acetylmuramoyl-L-alanyl-D-glutamate--2,6-diaminopimelate ligase [Desulfobacterales bacterium]
MTLSDLLKSTEIENQDYDSAINPEITSIHYDTRTVKPGGLFVAIPGLKADGHDYIDTAIEKGASAIIAQKPVSCSKVCVQVRDTRKTLASVSSRFYGNPSEHLHMTGITGTNGKTTVTYMVESILECAGFKPGVIGTINYRYMSNTFENHMTTPESLDLQKILAEMRDAGVTHVIMEISSHAIDMSRIAHCRFDLVAFTNLTQDHLDYHNTMDEYWACKKRLFTEIIQIGPKRKRAQAVINCDDPKGKALFNELNTKKLSVGHGPLNLIKPHDCIHDRDGIRGSLIMPGSRLEFSSVLVGAHNLENILIAAGIAAGMGLSASEMRSGIDALTNVPGRLEKIADEKGRYIYVDYAHTPDALKNVLSALKKLTTGRIISVFGCGGDRDRAKRPMMGDIAARFSDLAIVTSDNPRTEKPKNIIADILSANEFNSIHKYVPDTIESGFRDKGYAVVPDRRKAIDLAITVSVPGDTVLVAGKGHENYQIIGKETIQFDDRIEITKALKKHAG